MPRTHISMGDAGITPRSVTRRDALRLFMGAGVCATFFPAVARAETTQEKLDAAQLSYDEAQSKLDQIGQEYSAIADQLSQTQAQVGDLSSQIDAKQAEIEQKQTEIDAKQAEVEAKQQQLGDRMCSAYKSGGSSVLDILLSSATFEELTSNIYYLDKISAADQAMISEVKDLKAELESQKSSLEAEKAELESQKSQLESLQSQQEQQLEEAQAKQAEAQDLVSNLSSEVKELMAQRDAELLAAQKAAEEAARQVRRLRLGRQPDHHGQRQPCRRAVGRLLRAVPGLRPVRRMGHARVCRGGPERRRWQRVRHVQLVLLHVRFQHPAGHDRRMPVRPVQLCGRDLRSRGHLPGQQHGARQRERPSAHEQPLCLGERVQRHVHRALRLAGRRGALVALPKGSHDSDGPGPCWRLPQPACLILPGACIWPPDHLRWQKA